MTKLPVLEPVKQLRQNVLRVLGCNPSPFTLQGTNTYLLGTQPQRVLIDTGEGSPEYFQQLQSCLAAQSASVGAIVVTHWHKDHTGGLGQFPNVPVYKFPHESDPKGVVALVDEQLLDLFGVQLRVLHTPGHTTDHVCLLFEDVLFSGDNVLGHGTTVYENYTDYMRSLDRMLAVPHGPIMPGHGEFVEDGPAKIKEYMAHRRQREQQVLRALDAPLTPQDITKTMYDEEPRVMAAAERGVVQFLHKLEAEGKVRQADGLWSRL